MVDGWVTVIGNPEICAGFEPKIIREAGVNARRIEVLRRVGGHWQQRIVDVRRGRAALNLRPIMILHQNDEYRFDAAHLGVRAAEQESQTTALDQSPHVGPSYYRRDRQAVMSSTYLRLAAPQSNPRQQ
jgi:hypothetical protein